MSLLEFLDRTGRRVSADTYQLLKNKKFSPQVWELILEKVEN